jgi:trk system potassium uptake protein TrkA
MLTKEQYDITVIDIARETLDDLSANYDLLTVEGSSFSVNTLKDANVAKCNLFIAVTSSEEVNLLSSILAKRYGAQKTIARINDMELLSPENKTNFTNLGIDRLICPELIAAKEIVGVLKQTGTSEITEFSGGKLSLYALRIENNSPILGTLMKDLAHKMPRLDFRVIAIIRDDQTIIPNGNDSFQIDDTVYVIINPKYINILLKVMGIPKLDIDNIIFLGANRIGINAAKFLESSLHVKLFEKNEEKCYKLNDILKESLIIHHESNDFNTLLNEGLANTDAFVAVTGESEVNMMTCLLAKKYGVKKTIAEVENNDLIEIATQMGIDKIINKKLSTASYIYRFTTKAKISSISWLAGSDAEVLEFDTTKNAVITKNKIKDIRFPEGVIIGGVGRGNKSFIVKGDTQIEENDKVVVFALADAIHKIEYYF